MEKLKHSAVGIASFATSVVAGIHLLLLLLIAETSTPGGVRPDSPEGGMLAWFLVLFMGLQVVAVSLGIGGLAQKDRKQTLSVLGIVFSAGSFLTSLLLLVAWGHSANPKSPFYRRYAPNIAQHSELPCTIGNR